VHDNVFILDTHMNNMNMPLTANASANHLPIISIYMSSLNIFAHE